MNTTVTTAKKLAKELNKALSQLEDLPSLDHSQLLEVVAKGLGSRNWHAFLAAQTAPKSAVKEVAAPEIWSPQKGFMPEGKYLHHFGSCPVCGYDQIEGDSGAEFDGNLCWQKVGCNNCGSSWNDSYMLTGYSELELSDIAKQPYANEIFAVEYFLHGKELVIKDSLYDWIVESRMSEKNHDFLVEALVEKTANITEGKSNSPDAVKEYRDFARTLLNQGTFQALYYLREQYFNLTLFLEALSEKVGTTIDESML